MTHELEEGFDFKKLIHKLAKTNKTTIHETNTTRNIDFDIT